MPLASLFLLIALLAGCTGAPTVSTPTLPTVAPASPTLEPPSPTVSVPTAPPSPTTVPVIPSVTAAPPTTTVAASSADWKPYVSAAYGVTLRYPPDWTRDPRYSAPNDERLTGPSGFVQISAAAATSVDELADREANHVLQPYGSKPTIAPLQIQGQPARLILPSADQPPEMKGQAAVIVRSARSIQVGTSSYGFVVLWADQDHVRAIADTLRFAS